MIHDELVTYKVAKLAKAKRFPQHPNGSFDCCYYHWDGLRKIHSLCSSKVYYDDEFRQRDLFRAPTQSSLQRWLREQGIDIEIYPIFPTNGKNYGCRTHKRFVRNKPKNIGYFSTFELALEDALKYTLENLV